MTITWTRVASIPFTYLGCGIQGITCLGGGNMVATIEEDGTGPAPAFLNTGVLRVIHSSDNGQTWHELLPNIQSFSNISFSRLRTPAYNSVLAGQAFLGGGVVAFDPIAGFISRSNNGGSAFVSAVTSAFWNTIGTTYSVLDFVITDRSVVLALGDIAAGGDRTTISRSVDGGVSFTTLEHVTGLGADYLLCGGYLGNRITLVGSSSGKVCRSVDLGVNWAITTLSGGNLIRGIANIGPLQSGRVIVVAGTTANPNAFLSTDFGQTWANINIAGVQPSDVLAASTLEVIVGLSLSAAQIAGGAKPWRESSNAGLSFADTNILATPLTPGADYDCRQLAMSDDGAILAAMATTDAASPNEIWRGVIQGFNGLGPCVPITPPDITTIGRQVQSVNSKITGEFSL